MTYYDSITQFRTSDLALAAALSATGFTIDAIEKTHYGKAAFIFERDTKIDEVIQQYWADKLVVNPRVYFDLLKHIKTRIYSEQ